MKRSNVGTVPHQHALKVVDGVPISLRTQARFLEPHAAALPRHVGFNDPTPSETHEDALYNPMGNRVAQHRAADAASAPHLGTSRDRFGWKRSNRMGRK
ncbi:hypothetical protein Isop_3159 [Isosphaera pallida ATCC 43644]|uniref:Uncharacterized protein n=1 Tax=Isosphaera pallida (strain ATCC 43644 / DSM 9630 / IS1B) TaxID=575540 RepID=E8R3Z3_ISOPI|nr:hypothetical protein [Isosphaera pallida]ADV63723.1 hypothetical protein Isop_3159 [Isosphaera pallida ATCC 43644]